MSEQPIDLIEDQENVDPTPEQFAAAEADVVRGQDVEDI